MFYGKHKCFVRSIRTYFERCYLKYVTPKNTYGLRVAHLRTVGAYFNEERRVVGLAEDTAWHEVVHELVHLKFATRDNSSTAGSLRKHWLWLRSRGYSERVAEELVCRAHEMHAITSSGAPPWRWGARALLLWDSTLIEAQRDLAKTPDTQRSPVQKAEWQRIARLRNRVTGPWPRLAYCAALGLVTVALASSFVQRVATAARADAALRGMARRYAPTARARV